MRGVLKGKSPPPEAAVRSIDFPRAFADDYLSLRQAASKQCVDDLEAKRSPSVGRKIKPW
jgi:hypothetical protein